MCGRYTLHTERELLARRFRFDPSGLAELAPRYNVAPTQPVATVRLARDGRVGELMRWGLVPHFARAIDEHAGMINARVETAASTPAYRDSFRRRRCLVLADGFYEWKRGRDPRAPRTPYWIHLRDGAPFAMAGLWASWEPRDLFASPPLHSCAILTTDSNALVAPIHDRMPVILHPEAEDAWLDPALDGQLDALRALLVPPPAELLVCHPVSRRVNSARSEGPDLIEPAPAAGF
jgi:putative SOS response-associated peptidase YedK